MVYLFLADGFEEIEALTPVDVLRRGGVQVNTVSIMPDIYVTGARGITVKADTTLSEIDYEKCELFVLPGGLPGADNLENCRELCNLLVKANGDKKYIAAICAAPKILGKLGILKGKTATCYPGYEDTLEGARVADAPIFVSGNVVTGNAMGSSLNFALTLLDLLTDKAEAVAKGILYDE